MSDVPTIAPADLARLLAGSEPPVLLAVSTEAEHGRRRIPGSRRFTDIEALSEQIERTRLIVLAGCAPRDLTCDWALLLLIESGFRDVRVLAGGLADWVALGLPIESDTSRPITPTSTIPPATNPPSDPCA